jgi:hypothetical protein
LESRTSKVIMAESGDKNGFSRGGAASQRQGSYACANYQIMR